VRGGLAASRRLATECRVLKIRAVQRSLPKSHRRGVEGDGRQPRGTQRYRPILRADEDVLTQRIINLACQYGRYGYRRITAMVNRSGLRVSRDRVARIWRREALQVPRKQRARGRLAARLQHGPAAQRLGLPTAGPGARRAPIRRSEAISPKPLVLEQAARMQ
jgi:hypothetical protein